jgi:hypothetical protein
MNGTRTPHVVQNADRARLGDAGCQQDSVILDRNSQKTFDAQRRPLSHLPQLVI